MSYYNPTAEENEAYKQLFIAATKGQSNTIGGPDAVKFFVSSGLHITALKQIWTLASNGQKEMGPREFSTAMRLIALAQAGHAISDDILRTTEGAYCKPPSFQNIEIKVATPPSGASPAVSVPPAATGGSTPTSWAIPAEQRAGYEKLWNGLQKNPQGMLEGKDAAAFFAKSGQNRDVLRNVWQLADVGGDGLMDLTEFLIGMHLTMMAKKGATLPSVLPPDLQRSAAAPMERGSSNVSLSASMMAMGASSTSMLAESDKDLNSSRLQKQQSSRGSDASGVGLVPATNVSIVPPAGADPEYDSLRQDATALNNSMAYSVGKIEESRGMIRQQSAKASSELSALRGERERLMKSLNDATSAFNADMEKLRQLDEELTQMRDEVSRLRQGVDAKRAAIGAQQDLIGARLDETRNLSKQIMGATLGAADQAGQKRRAAPVPPPAGGSVDMFQNSGFPSGDMAAAPPQPGGMNAFDAFDDPYATQGTGGKSNEY